MPKPESQRFWVSVTDGGRKKCILKGRGFGNCTGPIQAHHVVTQQRLRIKFGRATDKVYDTRNAVPLCHRHHHQVTVMFIKIPRTFLPHAVFDFAREVDMMWALRRDLG